MCARAWRKIKKFLDGVHEDQHRPERLKKPINGATNDALSSLLNNKEKQ